MRHIYQPTNAKWLPNMPPKPYSILLPLPDEELSTSYICFLTSKSIFLVDLTHRASMWPAFPEISSFSSWKFYPGGFCGCCAFGWDGMCWNGPSKPSNGCGFFCTAQLIPQVMTGVKWTINQPRVLWRRRML